MSKRYFYGLGQSARALGLTKEQGIVRFGLTKASPFVLIAFDAGYRGF